MVSNQAPRTEVPPQKREKSTETIAIRSFAVLEQFVRAAGPMTLDDATRASGLPKPTMFRILASLHSAGLLRRDPKTKQYMIGPRLTAFGLDLWRQSALRAQWRRVLQEVVDRVNESVNLTVLEGSEVLYLDRVETTRPLRLHLEPGTRVALHATASGKLFLTQMTPAHMRTVLGPEPFRRYTPHTITSYRGLEKDLETVRRTQVGTHDSEMFEDSVAIAVPVSDAEGRIFAAIALHAPLSRLTLQDCMAHVPLLQRAAASIAETLIPVKATVAMVPRSAREGNAADKKRLKQRGRRVLLRGAV